jgi:hypothetical protein
MNIYITATPEINKEMIDSVCNELNIVNGEIKFIPQNSLNNIQLKQIDSTLFNHDLNAAASFKSLFKICSIYRLINSISEEDFVVLLTSIRNEDNWFSATEKRNVFIDINDWDKFTGKDPKYGISYQVIENLFQSLIGISHYNSINHPNVHFENDGCINDFCQDKSKVIIKLRTADICSLCQEKARTEGVNIKILNQIQYIMESIRRNVRNLNTFNEIRPEVITVDQRGRISIGDKIIEINKLPSTLYIFFLNQNSPIKKTGLRQFFRYILSVYERLNGRGNTNTIDKLIDPNGKAFRQNKWHVNSVIANTINESIVGYYIIDEVEDNKYFINLPQEYKNLDNSLLI